MIAPSGCALLADVAGHAAQAVHLAALVVGNEQADGPQRAVEEARDGAPQLVEALAGCARR